MEIVLATRNRKKVEEIRRMFMETQISFLDLNDFPDSPDVEETGSTFAENADLKACTISRHTQRYALADDSGLVVDALNGEPGVRSARYAGANATDQDNLNLLLTNLHKDPQASRTAHFECVLSLCSPQGIVQRFTGLVDGVIIETPKGSNGFGYDPVFVPQGERLTFAEMPGWQKDQISHRGRALTAMAKALTRQQPVSIGALNNS
ncbi:MAG: XTP/dITP diphosphatase [Magnetococcales bacterium]|nr:XTP/dITP diphosphatase [Magnetococcales bacterium]